jgi:hypothetical protein
MFAIQLMYMNYLSLLLLSFQVSAFAQEDKQSLAVISAEKLNIVYRGVSNPIKIAVPGIKSQYITAIAPELTKAQGEGNYIITPIEGEKVEIKVTYQFEDGSRGYNSKTFLIKEPPLPMGALNGENCSKCVYHLTKDELINSKVDVIFPNFLFVNNVIVSKFKLVLLNNKNNTIVVQGNLMDKDCIAAINAAENKSDVMITDIEYHIPCVDAVNKMVSPIKIIISDRK